MAPAGQRCIRILCRKPGQVQKLHQPVPPTSPVMDPTPSHICGGGLLRLCVSLPHRLLLQYYLGRMEDGCRKHSTGVPSGGRDPLIQEEQL